MKYKDVGTYDFIKNLKADLKSVEDLIGELEERTKGKPTKPPTKGNFLGRFLSILNIDATIPYVTVIKRYFKHPGDKIRKVPIQGKSYNFDRYDHLNQKILEISKEVRRDIKDKLAHHLKMKHEYELSKLNDD